MMISCKAMVARIATGLAGSRIRTVRNGMNRLLGIAFLYLAMMLGWIVVGLFMLFAPARFGNLVHDSLMLFPEVRPGD